LRGSFPSYTSLRIEATAIKALLITNAKARLGDEINMDAFFNIASGAGMEIEHYRSESPEKSLAIIADKHQDLDLVIIAGGDGTISSLAPALYEHKLPFAIVPLGTANDLARELKIPATPEQAFELIVKDHYREIDLGRVNDNYFFNACHMGLGVKVNKALSKEDKNKFGMISYAKALIQVIKERKYFRILVIANERSYRLRSLILTVGNGKYFGGGNKVHAEADNSDGLLHLVNQRPSTIWELLYTAPLMRLGLQHNTTTSLALVGKKFVIKTTMPRQVIADGEIVTNTPAEFHVIPRALRVIAPET